MASIASSRTGLNTTFSENIQTRDSRTIVKDVITFIYDPEEGTIFGRTPLRWALLLGFYMAFYFLLLAFFAAGMAIFYWTLDWNTPRYQGRDSIQKAMPGLAFRPQPTVHSSLIRFVKGDASSYSIYSDNIEAYLQFYENKNQQGENFMDCNAVTERRDPSTFSKVCRFDLTFEFKDEGSNECVKQTAFGFADGQPCIVLKLNKLFNWMPEEYTNRTVPQELLDSNLWAQWFVTVKCEGETPPDKDNLGAITYIPNNGFHFKYFPYLNQQGYRSPIMFIRFENARQAQLMMVTCKAYAHNLVHNSIERAAELHFELLID